MSDFKNLKVPTKTHEKLAARAKALGMKHFVLADALLLVGLEKDNAALQRDVVNTQLTPPEADTTQEHE